ncbi:MAG TPA: HlyD family efflux transporter periplasmic adaptor subunit [candidate division Zixibacteria bacterium]|nr:HlyD family efflux transporter periplasmic adaptor subunit [candidate division Zixibacteria bacterium]
MRRLFAIVLLPVLLLAFGCSGEQDRAGSSGILETDEIIVSAEAAGRVDRELFNEGSEVKAGDTLVVIDATKLELEHQAALAGKASAEAQLNAAEVRRQQAVESESYLEKEYARIAALVQSGTGTTARMDQIEHELAQAKLGTATARTSIESIKAELMKIEAEIARIEQAIADCYPVSGIDGVVTEKFVDKGELLAPGKPIAKISNLNRFHVKVYLPLEEFSRIKVGDKATVDTETEAGQYPGTVVWTSEEAEFTPKNVQTKKSRANLVYAVKVSVDNSERMLKIGMPVYVTLDHE